MDWNFERYRTRDRLIDYDFSIVPAAPHSAGLSMVYPWENVALDQLAIQIFILAKNHGFDGTEEQFWNRFVNPSVVVSTLDEFPIPGDENTLYLDRETDVLYYYKNAEHIEHPERIARVGGAIVGYSIIGDITYLYLPVRALLMEDIILDCGDATNNID